MPRALFTAVTLLLVCVKPNAAGEIDALRYVLGISIDLDLLRDPESRIHQRAATWKTNSEIALGRKTPVFRLTNTSDSEAITMFRLSINDAAHGADAVVVAEQPSGMTPDLISPADREHGGDTASEVRFSFAQRPLRPHESFAFWLDIDSINSEHPASVDYRQVLWGQDVDNATVTVDFEQSQLGPARLFDFAMQDQRYGTAGLTTGVSRVFGLDDSHEAIGAFFFSQGTRTAVAIICEPRTSGLMGTGIAAVMLALVGGSWLQRRAETGQTACR